MDAARSQILLIVDPLSSLTGGLYFQYSAFNIIEQTIIKEFILPKLSNYFKVLQN